MAKIKSDKVIQKKSRKHVVVPAGQDRFHRDLFRVTSGSSGETYTVAIFKGEAGTCTCPWGTHRPGLDQRSNCSHVLAVLNELAPVSASGWANPEDAARQHRHSFDGGDGLVITVRKS